MVSIRGGPRAQHADARASAHDYARGHAGVHDHADVAVSLNFRDKTHSTFTKKVGLLIQRTSSSISTLVIDRWRLYA